jgi:hypothetical protein
MKIIFNFIAYIILLSQPVLAQKGFIAPFKVGNYYEYVYEESAITARYSAKITKDTLVNGKKVYTMMIYDEPAMGSYERNFIFDTTTLNLYSPGGFCPDSTGFNLLGGFKIAEGYYWDTCRSGAYFRSTLADSGTYLGMFNTGIPLKYFTRKDTVGIVELYTFESYSEMFGYVSFYRSGGSAFGNGPYGKTLRGAIIDGVRYGEILSDINQISTGIPAGYQLKQNYPNPFNPSTIIKFSITKKQNVKLWIFNSIGKEISVLVNETKPAGSYQYIFNAKGLTSGVYFYRLETENFSETRKMVLVK